MRNNMNKKEFVQFMAKHNNIQQAEASNIVDKFTNTVITALRKEKEIKLIGFGNYIVSEIAAKKGKNLQTNEPIDIPAYNQIRFKASKAMKEAIKK